jgi:hypothetical protein
MANMPSAAASTGTFDLNRWHRAIHKVTGSMALCFNKATPADLERWAKALREVAQEMETVGKQ